MTEAEWMYFIPKFQDQQMKGWRFRSQHTSKNLVEKVLNVFVCQILARFDDLVKISYRIHVIIDYLVSGCTSLTFHRLVSQSLALCSLQKERKYIPP